MRIALIGDSQGQGLWPHLSKLLAAAGHTVVLSRGIPGWGIPAYKKEGKLGAQLRAAAPELVVYSLGGNNYEFNPSKYADQVAWALAQIPQSAEVLWLGPAHATRADVAERHDRTAAMEPPFWAHAGWTAPHTPKRGMRTGFISRAACTRAGRAPLPSTSGARGHPKRLGRPRSSWFPLGRERLRGPAHPPGYLGWRSGLGPLPLSWLSGAGSSNGDSGA